MSNIDSNAKNQYPKHVISLMVANKPGVLIRISLVFARRGYNIDSLVVSPARDERFSVMNIVASGDAKTLDQILKQLNKLVDVISARDRTGEPIIEKELALIKIGCNSADRNSALQLALAMGCETIHVGQDSVIFQASGGSEHLDNIEKVLEPYQIVELVRTGKLLMSKELKGTSI